MIIADSIAQLIAPDTVDPTVVEELVRQATGVFGRALNRYLGEPLQVKETHRGGEAQLFLNDEPVPGAVLSVETRNYPTDPWTLLAADQYAVDGSTLYHKWCWPRGLSSVRVTYTKGFELGDGPPELRAFVTRMVLAMLEELGLTGAGALKSETIGDHSKTFATAAGWDPEGMSGWQAMAAQWRRRRL